MDKNEGTQSYKGSVVEYLSVFIACCVTDIIKYIEANYNTMIQ